MSENPKKRIVILDADPKVRLDLEANLRSYYNVRTYDDGPDGLKYMKKTPPDLIIMGEDVGSGAGSSAYFLSSICDDIKLQKIPLVHVLKKDRFVLEKSKAAGIKHHIFKPYDSAQVVQTVINILNTSVEKEWESLPETQRAALQNTVKIFSNLAEQIISGEAVDFKSVKSDCQPLVQAVENNDFKSILNGVRSHDDYTYAHSMRVATLLTLLGHAAGFKNDDQLLMSSGGLLHDVGKMMIPHEILNKPGRLTDEEFEVIKTHVPETMVYLKKSDKIPNGVFVIAEQHHEKIDGTGYPHGLKGGQLNELARMAAIVDVYSALTDRRVYKPPMPASKAMLIMTEEMTGHLDPHYIKLFRTILIDAKILE